MPPLNASPAAGFLAFHRLVIEDSALFGRLQAAGDPEAFAELAVECGGERGLRFSVEDVHAGLRAARRAWVERSVP